jgi:hypothetical protein
MLASVQEARSLIYCNSCLINMHPRVKCTLVYLLLVLSLGRNKGGLKGDPLHAGRMIPLFSFDGI